MHPHVAHNPIYYVAGMLIPETEEWMGRFHLKANEILQYAELDAQSVAEYEACMSMLHAQQVYMLWWDRVRENS